MPNTLHQTMPFRRPSSTWSQHSTVDPADMGTDYALELRLTPPDATNHGPRLASGGGASEQSREEG